MLIAKGCPRCAGDVTRIEDVGETYYSCLQCGHIEYRRPVPAGHREEPTERPRPIPVDRAQVRRRQLRRDRRRAGHAVGAR